MRLLHHQCRRVRSASLTVIVLSLVAGLLPATAFAHVRWFTPRGPYWDPEWQYLFSLPVLLAVVSALAVVAALMIGQRVLGDPLWPRPPFLQGMEPSAPAILGVQTAIALIYAATQLTLFVPNIELPRNLLGCAIAAVAILAGFTFITGVLTRVGALLILALFALAFVYGVWYEAIEQLFFVGIALYLVVVGRGVVRYQDDDELDRPPILDRLRPHALTILRWSAGLSIIILGFTEKLLAPDLGVAFLHGYHHFNIPQELGIDWFTDRRFVYTAGIVEVTAGVALLSGYLPRVVILAIWIPFNLGIPFLPPTELIGHLPILATMYLLLVRGTEGIPPPEPASTPQRHVTTMSPDATGPTR